MKTLNFETEVYFSTAKCQASNEIFASLLEGFLTKLRPHQSRHAFSGILLCGHTAP